MNRPADYRNKPFRIPHKGQDCVSIRLDGKHVAYSCYHHAPGIIAELEDGSDDVNVSQWGIPRAHSKGIVCCMGE
jgi:hypothetical protein